MATRIPNAVRRSILKRGAIGAASVAAVAVGAGAATTASKTVAPRAATGAQTLRFIGRGWHTDTKTLPGKGEQFSVYGELHAPGGGKVGEFFSTNVGVDSPFEITGAGVGTFEIHTLSLEGGTIVGVGIGGGLEKSYAIVGGTGKYAGARGSYLARQETYGLGGDGKAELLLTLLD